jgi:hypothetical protein
MITVMIAMVIMTVIVIIIIGITILGREHCHDSKHR